MNEHEHVHGDSHSEVHSSSDVVELTELATQHLADLPNHPQGRTARSLKNGVPGPVPTRLVSTFSGLRPASTRMRRLAAHRSKVHLMRASVFAQPFTIASDRTRSGWRAARAATTTAPRE